METLRFALFTRPNAARMFFRLSDEGVVLGEHGIAWHEGLRRVERPLADIRSVTLRRSLAGRGSHAGTILIGFAGGATLTVYGCSAMGGMDRTRAASYRDFVADLHERLSPDMRARISFVTGNPGIGASVAKLALLVMVVGIVTVVVMLAPRLSAMEMSEVLFVLFVLPLMVVPFWRLVGVNSGVPYHPDRIPGNLLP